MRHAFAIVSMLMLVPACGSSCEATTLTARASVATVHDVAFESGSLSAVLATKAGVALGSRTVRFAIKGESAGTAVTRGSGVASVDLAGTRGKFLRALTARDFQAGFGGDGFYCPSKDTGSLTITKR